MTTLELTLALPDQLAQEARAAGLLTPEAITALIQAEVRRRRIDLLFDAADRLAALELPPLSEAEVQAEVEAARQQRPSIHPS